MRALFNWLTLSAVGTLGSILGVDGTFLFNEERGNGTAGIDLGIVIVGGFTVGFAIDICGFGSTIVTGFMIEAGLGATTSLATAMGAA